VSAVLYCTSSSSSNTTAERIPLSRPEAALSKEAAPTLLVEVWDQLQAIEQSTAGRKQRPASQPALPSSCSRRFHISRLHHALLRNATHTSRPHPRLRIPHCSVCTITATAQHCTAARLHASAVRASTCRPRARAAQARIASANPPTTCLRLSARISQARPRGHRGGSSPAPLARESATQVTAENGYPLATVRLRQPGKGATGWDAGSLVCNNLHVQWILVQSTQQH
jgi:hypothetical protein